jgi:CRISPR system Cascade subunit CasB
MNNNRSSAVDVAARWWSGLQSYRADGTSNPVADRGALARLRRADLVEAMEDPATFDLFRQLGWRDPARLIDAALCAGVLAVVRQDVRSAHAARQLGVQSGGSDARPVLSALRFRRLIAAETPQDRLTALRRAVLLANATTNVRDVAAACLDWSDERRRRWAFEYYDAANAAPTQPTVTEETIQ